ncbi:MAG TPA: hypothetical protein VLG36_00705 [Candidatus Chromulinivoraceae bacterium]|nr:hypothetical protein [Candidatus Chromulinivoraceae bacterium]
MNKQTVTINGRAYDVHTGLPVDVVEPRAHEVARSSHAIHQTAQKSQTLNRKIVKKSMNGVSAHRSLTPRQDIAMHPAVAKFAPHPSGAKQQLARSVATDIAPTIHPIAAKANQQLQQKAVKKSEQAKLIPKPAQVIKQEAIKESLAKAQSHSANHQQVKTKRRFPRMFSVASASLALLLLGGYFTYLNMPSLSVRVAAAQAGVNASFPSYHPDGYSLKGPVAYSQGEVSMKFGANAGPQSFTVAQAKTSWDSSAVLDNYVKQHAGDNYITYDEHGLTIYTYGGNAAWVNGGVLYTISGDAPLSGDQIRHIATSM